MKKQYLRSLKINSIFKLVKNLNCHHQDSVWGTDSTEPTVYIKTKETIMFLSEHNFKTNVFISHWQIPFLPWYWFFWSPSRLQILILEERFLLVNDFNWKLTSMCFSSKHFLSLSYKLKCFHSCCIPLANYFIAV